VKVNSRGLEEQSRNVDGHMDTLRCVRVTPLLHGISLFAQLVWLVRDWTCCRDRIFACGWRGLS